MVADPVLGGGPGGRPSRYRRETVELARSLAMLGATDERMARVLGISVDVLRHWTSRYPDLREAIRAGRDVADTAVAKSLYDRAIGYTTTEIHTTTKRHKNGRVEIIQTPIRRTYPPDVTACIFWLANRQREAWRHVAHIEHEGAGGGPITFHHSVDLSVLSDAELTMARRIGLSLRQGQLRASNDDKN